MHHKLRLTKTNRCRAISSALLLVVCVTALLTGCAGKQTTAMADGDRKFDLKGVIVSVDKAARRVTVKHDAIPDYMPEPMTMPYPLKDIQDYDRLSAGDEIKAKLVVTADNRTWLEDIVVVKKKSGN